MGPSGPAAAAIDEDTRPDGDTCEWPTGIVVEVVADLEVIS